MPNANLAFEGRHVAITGGSGALGTAVVARLIELGATCHVPVFDSGELLRFPFVENPHLRFTERVDLTDERVVEQWFGGLPGLWASLHLAGGYAPGSLADTNLPRWQAMLDRNLTSAFLCCREAVKAISRRDVIPGGLRGGRIVNVSSRAGLVPQAGSLAYTVSKAGVAALSAALADELLNAHIWVNAIAPSIIDTPSNRKASPAADHNRWPTPDQVATAILQLASPHNQVITGATVPVYGRA